MRRGPRPAPVAPPVAALVVVLLALALTLAGCSGADTTPKPEVSPADVLASAKTNLDDTSGVRIGLSTPTLPKGVSGLLAANGIGTHAPAFDGTIKVSAAGVTADADVVAVDGKVYAQLPFTSKFVPINPPDYGAPDPADLLATKGGLSSLLTAATKIQTGKKVRDGPVVLRSYTAEVPGEAVASVIPSADPGATFSAIFTVDDQDRLAKAVLSGPFYPQAPDAVTYTISFKEYGVTKDITAP